MDNALIVDVVIGVVLLAGLGIGAARGLFKSLMGLVVIVASLVGAVFLAGLLTDPIADMVAPKVEDSIVRQFSEALASARDEAAGSDASAALSELREKLALYGVPVERLDELLGAVSDAARDAGGKAADQATATFREAISATIRAMVRTAVHAVLLLVLYIVLLVVLKLLTRALDHVFDLPVLSTVNGVGGAALGLLEAAVLLYVALYIASHLGVKAVAEHMNDTYLLPLFVNHSPVELIVALIGKF